MSPNTLVLGSINILPCLLWASQVAVVVKNLPANSGDVKEMGLIPGLGRTPGGGHGNPLSILAWRLPRTEEPDVLLSIGSQSRTPLSNLLQCENRDKGSVLKSSFLVP